MDSFSYQFYLKEFLAAGLERCMKSVNAYSGSFFLFDDNSKELILEIAENPQKIPLAGIRNQLGKGISGSVALARKPLLVENIDNEPQFASRTKFNHYLSKSFLSVPVEYSHNLLGVINITDKNLGVPFNDIDLRIVLSICEYLGMAHMGLKTYLEKHKRLNEKLAKELIDLQKSFDQSKKFSSLGKVVGGLVHEINNPLDGVMRYVNLASGCIEEDSVAKEYLNEAQTGLSRIAKIVRSLLDFSWSLSPQESFTDVNRVIEDSLFMMGHYISSYNIEVRKDLVSNLPKISDYRLKIVFNNIIKNACEAMKNGGVLSIETKLADSGIQIRFSDTGEGIAKEVQEKIFEPFFTTKNIGEGSGLGLAISYEIIQRYKGTIVVESEPNKGTTFIISLPIGSGE